MVQYCKSKKCLVGKTAIITGGNTGLGYQTALDFAKRGGRVILACRNREKAYAARDIIIQETDNINVIVKIIDLESFDSVRNFAEDINDNEERLDILVNNAGALLEDRLTTDGIQAAMQTNHFSHFLLTILLLDLLKKSAPSRVVVVSSAAAKFAWYFNIEEYNYYSPWRIFNFGLWEMYSRTKLCNILFTMELAKRLEGTGVTAYSLHPGSVYTEAQRNMPILSLIAKLFFLSPEEGAQTQIYVSLEDGIEQHSGKHFEDCTLVSSYYTAKDEVKAKDLWKLSEKVVSLDSRQE